MTRRTGNRQQWRNTQLLLYVCGFALGIAFLEPSVGSAQELLGAKSVLQKVLDDTRQQKPTTEDFDLHSQLEAAARDFVERLNALSPNHAAAKWLELYDLYVKLDRDGRANWQRRPDEVRPEQLLDVLPGPDVWPELVRQIDARPVPPPGRDRIRWVTIRILGHRLAADWKSLATDFDDFEQALAAEIESVKDVPPVFDGTEMLPPISQQLAGLREPLATLRTEVDPRYYVEHLRQALEKPRGSTTDPSWPRRNAVDVGRLQQLTDRDEVERLVGLAVRAGAELEGFYSLKRMRLVSEVVRRNRQKLKRPYWELCNLPENTDLFEAFIKLPELSLNSWGNSYYADGMMNALRMYAAGLMIEGRTEDIIRLMTEPRDDNIAPLNRTPDARVLLYSQQEDRVLEFLSKLLSEHPELALWSTYLELASLSGNQPEAMQLVDVTLKREDLAESTRDLLVEYQRQWKRTLDPRAPLDSRSGPAETPIETEQRIIASLLEAVGTIESSEGYQSARSLDDAQELLHELVVLYHRANRPRDVIELLDTAPWWGERDLGDVSQARQIQRRYVFHEEWTSTWYAAARSLMVLNRKDDARRIAEGLVIDLPEYDPGWQLAMELTGDDFPKLASSVYELDRTEVRPLIWLATWQLKHEQLGPAEATIRRALAIDPRDEYQIQGDRLRALRVLSDVLQRQGDVDAAYRYDRRYLAVRVAMDAQILCRDGLLVRAIPMYRESLELSDEVSWIHFELAEQLVRLGDLVAAQKHFEEGFKRMPEDFGPHDDLRYFSSDAPRLERKATRDIAKRVFAQLATEQPNDARVQFLMGVLSEHELDDEGAARYFRKAVELDPEYQAAWQRLLSAEPEASSERRDLTVFTLLKFATDNAGDFWSTGGVRDLAQLCRLGEQYDQRPKKPTTLELYPLKASTQLLQSMPDLDTDEFSARRGWRRVLGSDDDRPVTPSGNWLTRHEAIEAIDQLLNIPEYESPADDQ